MLNVFFCRTGVTIKYCKIWANKLGNDQGAAAKVCLLAGSAAFYCCTSSTLPQWAQAKLLYKASSDKCFFFFSNCWLYKISHGCYIRDPCFTAKSEGLLTPLERISFLNKWVGCQVSALYSHVGGQRYWQRTTRKSQKYKPVCSCWPYEIMLMYLNVVKPKTV